MDDDGFFGFDTTIPDDDGGGGRIAEPPEEEYDALNDETFGSAINGDWEEAHETMVRLGGNGERIRVKPMGHPDFAEHANGARHQLLSPTPSLCGSTPAHLNTPLRCTGRIGDSDLELNLASMKLDDVDLSTFGDTSLMGGRVNLDSTVWAAQPSHFPKNAPHIFRENFRSALHAQPQTLQINPPILEPNANIGMPLIPPLKSAKISTLEDIERNLIIQQAIPKQPTISLQNQSQLPAEQRKLFEDFNLANRQHSGTPQPHLHPQQQQASLQAQQQQQKLQFQKVQDVYHKMPPGFMGGPQTIPLRPNIGFPGSGPIPAQPHPLPGLMPTPIPPQQLNGLPSSGSCNRVPPGFIYPPGMSQHPLLGSHGALQPNFPRPLSNPHLPTALNNFAMHPSFNVMRAAGIHPAAAAAAFMQSSQQTRLPPHPLQSANNLLQQQQSNSMYNMFNMRLVQEIQQNHPLLQNAAVIRQQQQQQQQVRPGDRQKHLPSNQQPHNRRPGEGNLPQDEYDEYANLMSTRDKHWLIGIQLSQLNTDTPYIDDYYFTMHRERKSGQTRHSQAHKDNQLNHPLTQPRGHAQLILVQLGNKNGLRNGQHRERRNSENASNNNNPGGSLNNNNSNTNLPGYIFSPLKFENSLGKLQYGSVTAPRKIIDADIMGSDATDSELSNPKSSGSASPQPLPVVSENVTFVSTLRKSRHILLHIETLYRYLLKLEDLDNPDVMATIILKKKKESERIAALEQVELANKTPEERAAEAANPQPMNPQLKNKFNYDIEPRAVLINKLKTGLIFEKVVSMMNVRKGKILLRRVMPFISDETIRWTIWAGIFCSLQTVVKKDRDDVEGTLIALYPEFKKHIQEADFEAIVSVSAAITFNDKKLTGILCSRFGILSLVCLILRTETLYQDCMVDDVLKRKWLDFLAHVASCLNRTIQNQTITAAIESDAIQPLINHIGRFKDLKLDALLALITEAKQQID